MQKITKHLTLAALATVAVLATTLLFQTPIAQAGGHGKRDEHGQPARVTFTKWVTAVPFLPGLIANMGGVVGGEVGDGTFAGELLLNEPTATGSHKVAVYHFTGLEYSFTALVDVVQTGVGPGATAAITGVVTDGWLQGHALEGEYTEIVCGHDGINSPCWAGILEIQRDSRQSGSDQDR
jgi:hypothetical protein